MYSSKSIKRYSLSKNIKKSLRKNKNKKYGGKVIGAGGYGCVFSPPLLCDDEININPEMVSKLMLNGDAEEEWTEITTILPIITQITNYENYFLLKNVKKCKPKNPIIDGSDDSINYDEKCGRLFGKKKMTVDNLADFTLINTHNGGKDLREHWKTCNTMVSFTETKDALINLLQNGIIPLNQSNVYHLDVKGANILFSEIDKKARLIDWGLAKVLPPEVIKDFKTVSGTFQFNVPHSSILLFFDNDRVNMLLNKGSNLGSNLLTKAREVEGDDIFKERCLQGMSEYIVEKTAGNEVVHLAYILKMYNAVYGLDGLDGKEEIFRYIEQILISERYITQTLDSKTNTFQFNFQRELYLSEVYLPNVDIWGFLTSFYPFIENNSDNLITESLKALLLKYCFNPFYAINRIPVNEVIADLKTIETTMPTMPTTITTENIVDLVKLYIENKPALPEDLKDKPIGEWNVSMVKSMSMLFKGYTNFNEPLDNWNVGKVTNMEVMFYQCTNFNQDLSNWNVGKVTNMGHMFYKCTNFDKDLSKWNVSNVTSMKYMFFQCTKFNQDLSNWNVGNVTNMEVMFYECINFDKDLSNWNVGKVTNMGHMFEGCTEFNRDLSKWDISKVTNMLQMFYKCTKFDQDLSKWDISKVTNKKNMFSKSNIKEKFKPITMPIPTMPIPTMPIPTMPITTITTENIVGLVKLYITNKPALPEDLNKPIGNWNVSMVKSMSMLFKGYTNFNEPLDSWDVSNVTNMDSMFYQCTNFNQDLSKWNVSNVTNMEKMFFQCTKFDQDLSKWNVSNVTNMQQMFYQCLTQGFRPKKTSFTSGLLGGKRNRKNKRKTLKKSINKKRKTKKYTF